MQQRSMFDEEPPAPPPETILSSREPYRGHAPFRAESDTSEAAAAAAMPTRKPQRVRVLEFLQWCGRQGATDEQIADTLQLTRQTVCPRRKELVELGEVVDSGQRRLMRSGLKGAVWVVRKYAPREPS